MKVGLVLSGGFAKGAYQVGALRAISEFIPLEDIACISSASIGAPNAYAFINGRLDRIEEMWKDICDTNSRLFITKILRSSLLQQDVKNLCEPEDKLNIPFYVSYFDVTSIADLSVSYKDLAKKNPDMIPTYLKASIAFPLYNKSVKIGARNYFDGGFIDNIPVYPLVSHDLDYIICIYFDDIGYKFEHKHFDDKIIKVTFPNMSNIKNSFFVDKRTVEEMISEGYERTMYVLRSVLANGHEDLEFIYRAIGIHNKHVGSPKLRLTTDVVITNVNKALSLFMKRKNVL